MTSLDGAFDGQELWFRCHFCGDSDRHTDKAHCSVNIYTNVYYCLKCQASGRLGSYDMTVITKGIKIDPKRILDQETKRKDDWLDIIGKRIRSGAAVNRYSSLDRYHLLFNDGTKTDVFKSCKPDGTVVGYHIRPQDKKQIRTFGQKMLGVPSKLKRHLSTRLVEGPWDCVDPHRDVCVFGFPTETQVRALAGYSVILCPDGDVFQDYRKLRSFMKPFLYQNDVWIEYVEYIPDGLDPDECLPSQRDKLSLDEVRKMLTPKRTFFLPAMKPKQILDDIVSNQTEEQFWGLS